MKRLNHKTFVVALGTLTLMLPLAQSWAATPTSPAAPKSAFTLEQLYAQQLPLLQQSLKNIQQAVKEGQKDQALMELKKAQTLLALVQHAVGQQIKPAFINSYCPIMGTKIDPAKVTPALTREFHGQKVAFCCPMCTPQWDKLSDVQKQDKLTKVLAKAKTSQKMNMGMDMHRNMQPPH